MIWKFLMKLIISWEESYLNIHDNFIRANSGGICVFLMGVFYYKSKLKNSLMCSFPFLVLI